MTKVYGISARKEIDKTEEIQNGVTYASFSVLLTVKSDNLDMAINEARAYLGKEWEIENIDARQYSGGYGSRHRCDGPF